MDSSIRFGLLELTAVLVLLVAIVVLSASPVEDGDFWWQMAYGRFMLEQHTLIPDHSVFSWTPAGNDRTYCAWIAEILLYITYQQFGIVGASMYRYLAMFTPLLLVWWLSTRSNYSMSVPVLFYLFLCYSIARHAGGILKPELFSFIFFSILVALYFAVKSNRSVTPRLIYAVPATMLVWVNSHGGFIIGCFFLGVVVTGELINKLLHSPSQLATQLWKPIGISIPLTMLAICITPYGYEHPAQIIGQFLQQTHFSAYEQVSAYQSIFSESIAHLGMHYYTIAGALLLLPFFVEAALKNESDYALIILNVAFFIVASSWGRFSYFYPVVMVFTFLHLSNRSALWKNIQAKRSQWRILAVICITTMATLTAYNIHARKTSDSRGPAFAAGYLNPASETEFIRTNLSDKKICNGYNGGGYLLWSLWPEQKVMIDPRYFPYASWYSDWLDIVQSKNPIELMEKFDCDLWVLNHTYGYMISALVRSSNWQPAFVGAAAVVFTRPEIRKQLGGVNMADETLTVTSLPRTAHILNLLLQLKEYDAALELSSTAVKFWVGTANEQKAKMAQSLVRGTQAYWQHDDHAAYPLLKHANEGDGVLMNNSRQIKSGQYLTEKLWKQGKASEALVIAEEVLSLKQKDIISLFNSALLQLQVAPRPESTVQVNWRENLQSFLKQVEGKSIVPNPYIGHARYMLRTGKPVNKPPLKPAARPAFHSSREVTWLL